MRLGNQEFVPWLFFFAARPRDGEAAPEPVLTVSAGAAADLLMVDDASGLRP